MQRHSACVSGSTERNKCQECGISQGGAYLCAPNMVSFVHYLVTVKSLFVMPMKFFRSVMMNNGCLFGCERREGAGLERD